MLKARIQKHQGKPLLFHDKCPGFFYVHHTTQGTYSFTSHPKDEAIMVKCLAQGPKHHDRPGWDSNPYSDNTRTWVQCARPPGHYTPSAYQPKGPVVSMQNSSYWPYVSNLAGSFSKAKWTRYRGPTWTQEWAQLSQVLNEHQWERHKMQSQVLTPSVAASVDWNWTSFHTCSNKVKEKRKSVVVHVCTVWTRRCTWES